MQNDIWLMEGDCLEKMKEIPDGSVDMILADLPYGTTACKWDVIIPFEPLWEQYWRVLKVNGAIALFGSEPFSSHLRMNQIKYFKYDWVWDKVKTTGFQIVKYKPMQQHEMVSIFYRKSGSYYPQKIKKEVPRHTGKRNHAKDNSLPLLNKYQNGSLVEYSFPKTILAFSNANQSNRYHPTQKPVPLLEYLIKTYTNEGETVFDNVMGSGSTGVACVNTSRKFIGIEKDEKYFQIARERIGEAILEKEDIFRSHL